MARVAIIGAGSLVFTKQFLNDMFGTPCMAGSTFVLMGPSMWKLGKMKVYADQLIEKNGIAAEVVCTLKENRDMVNEMFLAEKEWLPQFDLRDLRKLDTIVVPADTVPVPVPEDPALAIDHRFKVPGE